MILENTIAALKEHEQAFHQEFIGSAIAHLERLRGYEAAAKAFLEYAHKAMQGCEGFSTDVGCDALDLFAKIAAGEAVGGKQP